MVIIFPLREKIHRLFLQQRPKSTGGRGVILPPTLPFNVMNRPASINFGRYNQPPNLSSQIPFNYGLCVVNPIKKVSGNKKPDVVREVMIPADITVLTGVSRDNTGAVLGNCIINLFRVDYDSGNNKIYTHVSKIISDANGNFSFNVNTTSQYRVTADSSNGVVAGVSYDTLIGI
jgi:hypothetical protein